MENNDYNELYLIVEKWCYPDEQTESEADNEHV